MAVKIQALLDERMKLVTEDRAYLESDTFDPADEEGKARHEKIMGDIRSLTTRIDALKEAQRMEKEMDEQREEHRDVLHPDGPPQTKDDELRKQILDVIYGRSRGVTIPFNEASVLRESQIRQMKEMGPEFRTDILSNDAGTVYSSYLVPTTLQNRVNYHANAQSGVLKTKAFQFYTRSGEAIDVPKLVTDAAAAQTAEGTASTVTNPVFGKTTFNSYRQDGHFIVSKEMLEDSIVNVETILGDLAGRALATQIASLLASGTGSSAPAGVNYTTELSTSGVTAASATTFTMDELIELKLSVLPKYRMGAEWVFGTAAYLILAKMKDGEGRYLWAPSVRQGEPDLLMGNPVYEDAGFQACTTGKAPVVCGDWSTYWIRWARGGMEFARDDSVNFSSFESMFRFAVWMDADITDATGSLKHLTMG